MKVMKNKFLNEITFDTVFSHVEYIEREGKDKRVQMMKNIEPTKGYIIGSRYKYDGTFYPTTTNSPFIDDYEQGTLEDRISVKYWVVVVGMNEQYLVPKEEAEKWRFKKLDAMDRWHFV